MGTQDNEESPLFYKKLIGILLDEVPSIQILLDERLEVRRINQAGAIFYGTTTESGQASRIASLLSPEGQERLKTLAAILDIDGETFNTYFTVTDYLGAVHTLPACIRFIHGVSMGSHYYLLTLRKEAEKADRHENPMDFGQFVSRLLKGLSDSVMLIDVVSKTILDCNQGAEAMFGYSRDEILGRSPQFLAGNEQLSRKYIEASRETYAKTGYFQEKMICRRKDGSLFLTLATNIALFSGGGDHGHTLAINRDLSQEERRLEEILHIAEQSQSLLRSLSDSILPLRETTANVSLGSLGSLGFSSRQIEIAFILASGETTKVIASRLKLSESAIKSQLSAMYRRVGVTNRMEFVKYIHDRNIRLE